MTRFSFFTTRLSRRLFLFFSLPFILLAASVLILFPATILSFILFPSFILTGIVTAFMSVAVELSMQSIRGRPTGVCPTCGQPIYERHKTH